MRKLSEIQKKFIVKIFFKSDLPGSNNIAYGLLEKGEWIVAGDSCIWNGGIGNFIKTKETSDAYKCLTYKFDLEEFLKSAWFKEIHKFHVLNEEKKLKEVQNEYLEIRDISLN